MAYSQSLNRILPNCLNSLQIEALGNQLNYLPYDLPYDILPNYPGVQSQPLQPLTNVLQPLPNGLQSLPNIQSLANLQSLPNIQSLPLMQSPNVLQSSPNVYQPGMIPVIEDNMIASNLANALQLLVVSNLLRNTLPQVRDVVGYPSIEYAATPQCGLGSYNYVY